ERGEAGIPLDLFRTALPAQWIQKTAGGGRALLINWAEEERELSLDLSPHAPGVREVRDLWTGESVPVIDGRLICRLAPHACRLTGFS
ncbi:MAG: hypothetical protein U1E27_13965, partial [Kiritimatiellia bacterium]|nr:hypothetical protein [Kiritimatiellia bacterium]